MSRRKRTRVKNNGCFKQKYPVNEEVFLNGNEHSYYLLGAYMTDGNICIRKWSKSFSICSKDLDWIECIREKICPLKPIYKAKFDCHVLQCANSKVIDWMISYGCTPAKSLSLKIEKDIPKQYQKDFLRGIMDGDGSISYCRNSRNKIDTSVYICSGSIDFINQLKFMIPKDIKCRIDSQCLQNLKIRGKEIKSGIVYKLMFNRSTSNKLLSYLYDNNKISMPRKK